MVLLRLLWRSRKAPAYAKRWAERFGFINHFAPIKDSIWIHAVSLGEVLAATPLIKALQKQYPQRPFIITTLTPTGSEQVIKTFKDSVYHVYAPYDLPDSIERFLSKTRPALLIIIETEIWPNIIAKCKQHKIPVMIANGRLSEKSARGYGRFARLTANTLKKVTHLAVQTKAEADRFLELGMPNCNISITGNIKFDIELPEGLAERAQILKQQWGMARPVWIAASTHHGEDELVLEAFKLIRKQITQLLLILVPRHPERFNAVATLCEQEGFSVTRRSGNIAATSATDIFLGDTLGELLLFYQAADIAFVGGSLVPVGGHNLLEPAAIGIPVLTGEHMFNFLEVNRMLQAVGAAFATHTTEQIAQQVLHLLTHPTESIQAGKYGQDVIARNKGSLQKHLEQVSYILKKKVV